MIIFTIDLKNQPGELAHMCEALAQRGVNLAMAGLSAGDHGLVSFTASDEAAARTALNGASIPFTELSALEVKMADRPGEAARIARMLSDAHINIECWLPTLICQGAFNCAVAVDKMDDARRVLGDLIL